MQKTQRRFLKRGRPFFVRCLATATPPGELGGRTSAEWIQAARDLATN